MAILLSDYELRSFNANALLELYHHAVSMRSLFAQFVNSGPGGTYGTLDRVARDIEDRLAALGTGCHCEECGNFIMDAARGGLANRHHDPSCSLYDADAD